MRRRKLSEAGNAFLAELRSRRHSDPENEVYASAKTPSETSSAELATRQGGSFDDENDDFLDLLAVGKNPAAKDGSPILGFTIPPEAKEKSTKTQRLQDLAILFRRNLQQESDGDEALEILKKYPDLEATTAAKLIRGAIQSAKEVETSEGEY